MKNYHVAAISMLTLSMNLTFTSAAYAQANPLCKVGCESDRKSCRSMVNENVSALKNPENLTTERLKAINSDWMAEKHSSDMSKRNINSRKSELLEQCQVKYRKCAKACDTPSILSQ